MLLASTVDPRPVSGRYRFLAHHLVGTFGLICELPLVDVTYGRVLNGAGEFSASLPLAAPRERVGDLFGDGFTDTLGADLAARRQRLQVQDWLAGTAPNKTVIYVERDGVLMGGWAVWTRAYDSDSRTLQIEGAELWSYFRRRRIRWTSRYTATDQLTIARQLIDRAQQATGGNIGVLVGAETSGRLRDRTYETFEDKPLGEAVEQLAEVIDGFDFEVTVTFEAGAYVRRLRLHYPRMGRPASQTGLVFEVGRNATIGWPEDGTRTANSIAGLGAGEGPTMLRSVRTDTAVLAEGYPLLEDSLSLKDVSVRSTLTGHTAQALADRRLPATLPTVTALADDDPALGAYIPGDFARIRCQPGQDPRWPDGLDTHARIAAWRARVPDEGPETVEITMQEAA